MIQREGAFYTLTCDICSECSDELFDDFYEAVEYKKDKSNGWRSKKDPYSDAWEDICPDCCSEINRQPAAKKEDET